MNDPLRPVGLLIGRAGLVMMMMMPLQLLLERAVRVRRVGERAVEEAFRLGRACRPAVVTILAVMLVDSAPEHTERFSQKRLFHITRENETLTYLTWKTS